MKFLTTILVSLFVINIYSQADLDLTLKFVTDEPLTIIVHFGLDPTATNGIDPWLGEFAYPPDACGGPGGVFTCVAFQIPPPTFNEDISPRDYRYGVLPYSGQVEHRLGIGFGYYATQAEMFWDFPNGVSVHLEDVLGGQFFELDMQGAGSFVLTDSLSFWYLHLIMIATYNNVVPIELTSFTASILQNEKAVHLNWTTATETNNSGFEILRKAQNDNEWAKIGFVPGFGTTTEPKAYSFIDENITTGTYKYRLKQIDFDGSFTFSSEIEVDVDFTPKEFVLYQNYPNPFNPTTTIKFEIPNVETRHASSLRVTLKVYDVLGNEVATLVDEEKQPGVYEVEFDGSALTSGIYFYILRIDNFIDTKKLMLVK